MFKYSAITDNTLEMREWLDALGYQIYGSITKNTLFTEVDGLCTLGNIDNVSLKYIKDYINCISNPSLFRAVTAIRDDSDYMQFFVDSKGRLFLCEYPYVMLCLQTPERKATLEELIIYFKTQEI